MSSAQGNGRARPGGADDLPLVPLPVITTNPLHELVPDLRDATHVAQVAGVAVWHAD